MIDVNRFEDLEKNIDRTPKSDVIFKILFGDPRHPKLLIHLLNAIIKDPYPITEVEIQPTELTREFAGQRGVRLDILAKTSNGQLVNIEIQKNNEHNMVPRAVFYCAKIFSGQALISERYEDLKKTICISIMNFKEFDDKDYLHKCGISNTQTHELLTDLMEIYFLEIPKIRKLSIDSPLLFWLEFINNPFSERIRHMYTIESVYSEAKEAYENAIADPEVQELLRVRQKAETDYNDAMARNYGKGKAEGLEKGRAAEKIEIAKSLLSMGLSVEQASQATGLSIKEIEALR